MINQDSTNKKGIPVGIPLFIIGVPDTIRTCGPQIRNLMLYPAELRGREANLYTKTVKIASSERE